MHSVDRREPAMRIGGVEAGRSGGVGVGLVTVMRHCKFDVGESSNIRKVHYLWVSLDIIQRKY